MFLFLWNRLQVLIKHNHDRWNKYSQNSRKKTAFLADYLKNLTVSEKKEEEPNSQTHVPRSKPIFKNNFKTIEEEQKFIDKVIDIEDKIRDTLKSVTFVCVSGVYGSGKDTISDMMRTQFENRFSQISSVTDCPIDYSIKTIAYAKSLKDAISNIMGFNRDMLANDCKEKRDWMNDPHGSTALFWSGVLLRSKVIGYENHIYFSKDKLSKPYIPNTDTTITESGNKLLDKEQTFNKEDGTLYNQYKKILDNYAIFGDPTKSSLIPFTPRKSCEIIAELLQEQFNKELFVHSLIRNIYEDESKTQSKKSKSIYIISDARQEHEVIIPVHYGIKVIYIHIRRQELLNKLPWYPGLERFLSDQTVESNTHPAKAPKVDETEDFMTRQSSNLNIPLIPKIQWMPVWLQHHMKAKYGPHLYEYNKQNAKDVVYIDVLNEEGDFGKLRQRANQIVDLFLLS